MERYCGADAPRPLRPMHVNQVTWMKDTQKANQSVTRALQIMEILAESDGPLGVREVARQIRVSPAIAQRLVSALTESGFAEQESPITAVSDRSSCIYRWKCLSDR